MSPRGDNWNALFKPIFRSQEFMRESLQRHYPIRLCMMHARLKGAPEMFRLSVF